MMLEGIWIAGIIVTLFVLWKWNLWKLFAFCTAIMGLALILLDMVGFALGVPKMCHYTPFDEWIYELWMVFYAMSYMVKYVWEQEM